MAQTDPTPKPEPSVTPPPISSYVAAQEEFSPKWDATAGAAALLNLRGQLGFIENGQAYLIRVKVPFVSSAPADAITGMSDSTLFFLAVKNGWVYGATTSLPTGEKNSLGTGKYSIGPGFGYSRTSGRASLGFFSANYFSVIGPASRATVAKSQIQPILTLSLARGWAIGTSTMNFTYSWTQSKWIAVPFGVRLEKGFGTGAGSRYTAFLRPLVGTFELEKDLTAVPGTPIWTYRVQFKWNLPRAGS